MSTFNLKIVSFDQLLVDEPVAYCNIHTDKGRIAFEARHEAFVCTLKEDSPIEYRKESGESKELNVKNGIFLFRDNHCVITVFLGD